MKFLVTYRERRADFDPAAAQRRAARLLAERAMPAGLKVHQLLSRVAGGGGYAVVETADGEDLQHLVGLFAAYECRIEPVLDQTFNGAGRAERPAAALGDDGEQKAGAGQGPHGIGALSEAPPGEPREGAFSDDDVYDTED